MILKRSSQIIDQMVYLDNMGKNRFSKTLKIFLPETTRLIFCVALFSRYLPFLFKLCPWGHKLSPLGSHVLHRPRVSLQSVTVVFPDHTHLLFYNGTHEKILSETNKYI